MPVITGLRRQRQKNKQNRYLKPARAEQDTESINRAPAVSTLYTKPWVILKNH